MHAACLLLVLGVPLTAEIKQPASALQQLQGAWVLRSSEIDGVVEAEGKSFLRIAGADIALYNLETVVARGNLILHEQGAPSRDLTLLYREPFKLIACTYEVRGDVLRLTYRIRPREPKEPPPVRVDVYERVTPVVMKE